ncbi:hypothetical protein GW931_00555 [archaeon]|nr:hypothetical protein [archaeon]
MKGLIGLVIGTNLLFSQVETCDATLTQQKYLFNKVCKYVEFNQGNYLLNLPKVEGIREEETKIPLVSEKKNQYGKTKSKVKDYSALKKFYKGNGRSMHCC